MSPFLFFLCMLAAAQLALPCLAAAAEAEPTGPRITDCRIGFDGVYKIGQWTPIWIDVAGAEQLVDPRIELTVNDNDGVPTTVTAPLPAMIDGGATAALSVLMGRSDSPLSAALVSDGEVIDRQVFLTGQETDQQTSWTEVPAAGELLVALGAEQFGWGDAFPSRDTSNGEQPRRAVQLRQVAQLPTEWFQYDAVDVLVISVGDGKLCRELAADAVRMAALRQWVELGGRLVILCGGEAAQTLLAEGQPLAALVPGKVVDVVQLSQTGPLEHFAERSDLIAGQGERVELNVPKLVDVTGPIEAYAGQQPTDLPLVVRGPLGLGEVAFAGVDLSSAPLADWAGRPAFLRALLKPYVAATTESDDLPQALMTLGYNDLSGALRQRLGSSFANVTTIKFPAVASLAILYLALLGPVDYWLVHKVLRRPGLAWVTLALLITATSVGAYALAGYSKGASGPRVNQLELIDFDQTTGRARGTYWASLYSPESRRYCLGLNVSPRGGTPGEQRQSLLSSWGFTGTGIGGMDTRNLGLGIARTGYRYSPELNALIEVPLLTASTKSLLGRWTAPTKPLLDAQLTDEDGLVVGSLVNQSGLPLRNARLLYGTWAYRLGNLADGQQVDVGPHLNPIQAKTMIARSAGIAADRLAGEAERSTFLADRASAEELLNLMMFFNAGGGQAFAELPNHGQAYCDLSRLLTLGRAIVVAEAPAPESQLVAPSTGEPLAADGDAATVIVRFVLPVAQNQKQ